MTEAGEYERILGIAREIARVQDAGAHVAAAALVYVGIDTMTHLALPLNTPSQRGADFVAWVDRYLKADAGQAYQYNGRDVYAARCALLHSYGSIADMHYRENPPRVFGYLDNGPHMVDDSDKSKPPLVLISIAVLVRDFGSAVHSFLRDMQRDPELKERVDSRITGLLEVWDIRPQPK